MGLGWGLSLCLPGHQFGLVLPSSHSGTDKCGLLSCSSVCVPGASEQKGPAGSQSVINTQANTRGMLDVLSKNILEAGGCIGT